MIGIELTYYDVTVPPDDHNSTGISISIIIIGWMLILSLWMKVKLMENVRQHFIFFSDQCILIISCLCKKVTKMTAWELSCQKLLTVNKN